MKKSEITKKYSTLHWTFASLSIALTFVPVLVYVGMAFFNHQVTEVKKLTMGVMVVIAAILVVLNVLLKYSLRSPIWLCLIGIYICLEKIETLLIIMAVCCVLDEFICTPLSKKYKNLCTINKEIDKRGV